MSAHAGGTGRLRSLQRVRWKWQFIEESKGEKYEDAKENFLVVKLFMVFSLFMGSAGMIVKADGQKAVVRIARQDSTATGTVYYKWDTAAEWTEVNQTAYNDTPIEINRPDDSLDHTVHFKVVCGTDTIIITVR